MGDPVKGILDITTGAGEIVLRLNPNTGSMYVGKDKELELTSSAGGQIVFSDSSGVQRARIVVTGNGIAIQDAKGNDVVRIDCAEQQLAIGGQGGVGQILLRNEKAETQVILAAEDGGFSAGSSLLFQQEGSNALLRVGSGGRHGSVVLKNAANEVMINLDGRAGDVVLTNADCAEDFDLGAEAESEPGMVVVLDEDGRVRPCQVAYDSRVAGVISGAGGYRPAIVLDRRQRTGGHATVGLMGKVFCWVDADVAPVRAGALLTTSTRLGHAQVATDRARSFGAVLGKALASLDRGAALVPILVTLH